MLNMKPYVPSTRVAIRESLDDDLSDDIEDDVFIRDGKSVKAYEEKGLKRPLMAPRRRSSSKPLLHPSKARKTVSAILRKRGRCWKCCEPFCYAFAALLVLITLILLTIFLMALFPVSLQKFKTMFHGNRFFERAFNSNNSMDLSTGEMFSGEQTPCTQMSVSKVWSKAFSRLNTESPVRKIDINGDGILDIIFGYGVDDNIQYPMDHKGIPKCEIENGSYREMVYCEGGILALDGSSGNTIWQRWTPQIVFSLYCNNDLNKDGQIDCITSGRGGLVLAVNGKNGETLWHLRPNSMVTDNPPVVDLYTVNGVRDLDGDMIPDVLAAHVEEHHGMQLSSIAGHITIISGQHGKIIRTLSTPHQEELYVPLQLYTQIDGTEMILVITGGQNTAGGVYLITLNTLMDHSKEDNFITVFRSETSGFMVPAILIDLNEDGIDDIVVSSFNSTVYAFNGQTYDILWKYSFPDSESISSIVPGHYNNDNITDFMVKYNCGPGFPVYYYSQTQIINGKNGSALLDRMINDSGGANSLLGGTSISQTFGGDLFLHWQTHCRGKYDIKEPYQFFPDSDILLQSRADTCMLRYNTSTVLKLYAITRHIKPPGAIIFSTDDLLLQLNQTELKQLEKQIAVSPLKHPKLLKKLLFKNDTNSNLKQTDHATNTEQPTPASIIKAEAINNVDDGKKFIQNHGNDQNNLQKLKQRTKLLEKSKYLQQSSNDFVAVEQKPSLNNFEKPIYNEQTNQMDVQLPINDVINDENTDDKMILNQRKKQLKNYILNNMNRVENRNQYGGAYMQEPIQEQQQSEVEDYQNYYDENLAERKLGYAANNRDVRSDINAPVDFYDANYNDSFSSMSRSSDITDSTENFSKTKKKDKAETLWDLEFEKENEEQSKQVDQYLGSSSDEDSGRKRRQLSAYNIPTNQNLLAQISSTGVLLKSLDKIESTLDFVFVLNVRESELYPPLLLAEDVKCLEEKLNIYQNDFSSEYAKANVELVEKHFLKECLNQRLPNLTPHTNQFESQIVVTRISMTCSCGDLKTGEKCSTFNTIEKQRWTEFMGNLNNGVY